MNQIIIIAIIFVVVGLFFFSIYIYLTDKPDVPVEDDGELASVSGGEPAETPQEVVEWGGGGGGGGGDFRALPSTAEIKSSEIMLVTSSLPIS
jgi:hypothetical protein